MQSKAASVQEYIDTLPDDRRAAITVLRKVILENLPEGFAEEMSYGMIGYVVPHSLFPKGYRCNPKLPLPFINIASQKNFIAMYHMGIYANKDLLDWFKQEYPKYSKNKLDMGKGCIRFKNIKEIPFPLLGELASKITVENWIEIAESTFNK
ncbi:DUF1801 domain-containing protein [Mucilaginibacter arboris]|uniref:DUF1801 domain-containing protein n=1 Tax=Mucilaginibacter arboris TaxID=2682090 RepID=A0A7K1SZN0_9SPHI|nr:DUF1801 domain-containing protein [Mucilaginibacter arboris]MVN22718.1 DUF1801 domain-containing protein [Mucilaginibacter arboris]